MEDNVNLAPKVVVVIGNGFDLDLGLRTKYSQFVDSEFFVPLISPENPVYDICYDLDSRLHLMVLENNKLALYIKELQEHNLWVDLEKAIKDYCLYHKSERNSQQIKKEIYGVRYFLYKYIQNTDTELKHNQNLQKSIAYTVISALKSNNADFNIWNFNYTNTCETIMRMVGFDGQDINQHLYYIHGSISQSQIQESINIVLGTRYNADVHKICPSAIKSVSADKKYADQAQRLRSQLMETENLLIFGHAVGDSDTQYFEDVLQKSSKLKRVLVINYKDEDIENVRINLDDISKNRFGFLCEQGTIIFESFKTKGYFEGPFMNYIDPRNKQELDAMLKDCFCYNNSNFTLDI